MRVEGLSCGRLILCGGKVERGEVGRGKVKMAGGERPRKKQNPEPVGGGQRLFLFFSSGERCRLVRGRFRVRVFFMDSHYFAKLPSPSLVCVEDQYL